MKVEDIIRHSRAQAEAPPNCEDDFCSGGEDEEEDEVSTLVGQLEDCWFLLDALVDHFKNPKARMTAYYKREIERIATETASTICDYNITE